MANEKWGSVPSKEQISRGLARSCLGSIRETVEKISDLYGQNGKGAIRQYVLLVLRTPPGELRELNRMINGMIEQPDGIKFGAEIQQHAALMAEAYLKSQNRNSDAYPYASDFREGLSGITRDAMKGVRQQISIMPRKDAAQQMGMLRVGGAEVPAPRNMRTVVKLQPGDNVDDPVYRPWVMVLGEKQMPPAGGV